MRDELISEVVQRMLPYLDIVVQTLHLNGSIIDMKIKLLTILCFAILLTGCKNETVNGVTSIETTSTAGANSVSSISESETNVAEESTVEVSKEVSYEDTNAVDYSDIYITGFSADSEILCIEQDSFYKNFSAVIIENYIESDGNMWTS